MSHKGCALVSYLGAVRQDGEGARLPPLGKLSGWRFWVGNASGDKPSGVPRGTWRYILSLRSLVLRKAIE